jgi:hypothetical protein
MPKDCSQQTHWPRALVLSFAFSLGLIAYAARGASAADAPAEGIPTPAAAADAAAPEGEVVKGEPSDAAGAANGDVWSRPFDENPDSLPKDVVRIDQFGVPLPETNDWTWRWAPTGLLYHSYMAGEHEPRMALFTFNNLEGRNLWDATLGGRAGLVQYGNGDPIHPAGYQLDFYGAANPRLDADNEQDLEACDYVFGLPITFGDEHWQWKFGYAHLSSHLGDEYAIRHPGALNERINYVRDSLVLGTSYYLIPAWRFYGETGWAFNASGGAEPWDAQFGTEIANPYPSKTWTPFLAINGRMRQELDFGGDVTIQAGWMQRGVLGQSIRLGGQYFNGKSNQFQFYTKTEQQLGIGVWYDF